MGMPALQYGPAGVGTPALQYGQRLLGKEVPPLHRVSLYLGSDADADIAEAGGGDAVADPHDLDGLAFAAGEQAPGVPLVL